MNLTALTSDSVSRESGCPEAHGSINPLDVAVVIDTYESAQMTIECLRSLLSDRFLKLAAGLTTPQGTLHRFRPAVAVERLTLTVPRHCHILPQALPTRVQKQSGRTPDVTRGLH
jgi:hypothetical protein